VAAAVAALDDDTMQLQDCAPVGAVDSSQPSNQPARMQQEQQGTEVAEPQRLQQQQQRSKYVPRFTKRRQNYNMLLDSMQQEQQQEQDTATAAVGSDEDMGLIADVAGVAAAAAVTTGVKAVPQLSRRRLSTSTVAAAHPAAATAVTGDAIDDGDAEDAAWLGTGVVSSSKKPLLRHRLALSATARGGCGAAAGTSSQQQLLGGLSQAADDADEEGIEDGSDDSHSGTQPRHTTQQQQQQALGQWGRTGAVPTLGR
jgi:hypothetical protein